MLSQIAHTDHSMGAYMTRDHHWRALLHLKLLIMFLVRKCFQGQQWACNDSCIIALPLRDSLFHLPGHARAHGPCMYIPPRMDRIAIAMRDLEFATLILRNDIPTDFRWIWTCFFFQAIILIWTCGRIQDRITVAEILERVVDAGKGTDAARNNCTTSTSFDC